MRRALIVSLACTVALGGCGGCDSLDEGTIESKFHEDASTYTAIIPICTTSGGKYPTTTCYPIPYVMHDDEDWGLHLVKGEEEGDVYVDEETWNSVEEGEYFGGDGESVETSDEDEKVRRA